MAKTSFTSASSETEQDRAALLREAAANPEDIDFEMRPPASERFVQEAKETGMSLLDSQKRAAADSLDGWAQALRRTAEQLSQDDSTAARITQRAAEGLADFSGSLRNRDISSIVTQAQDFARRRPALFLGGALATGLLLARFLKSSGQRGSEDRSSWRVEMGGDQAHQTNAGSPGFAPEMSDPNPVGGVYETK